MNIAQKKLGVAAIVGVGMLFTGIASATPVTMYFDSINTTYFGGNRGVLVDGYYGAGCGTNAFGTIEHAQGSVCVASGGPDYGVVWADAVAGSTNGAFSNISNEPSPSNVMSFTNLATFGVPHNDYMNVAAGFTGGFSFYFNGFGGVVKVYDDVNGSHGTGNVIATLELSSTGFNCGSTFFSCWQPFGVSFSGTAKSVDFTQVSSLANYFDNVTLGSATPGTTPVPEPAALGMFGLGLAIIGLFAGLRRRVASAKRK